MLKFTPLAWLSLCFLLSFNSLSFAQQSADSYYQQCLRFEAAGDYLTAQQSCLTALEIDPQLTSATLALARVNLSLGRLGPAETGLRQLQSQISNPEVSLLLADIMIRSGRFSEAEGALGRASSQLASNPNQQQEAQLNFLLGTLKEAQGDFDPALGYYQKAVELSGLNADFLLAKTNLLFRLGNLAEVQQQIEDYQALSSDTRNPELLSLLAKTYWAQSRLTDASTSFEAAINQRNSRDGQRQSQDLLSLAMTYYGQGNTEAGNLAFRDALRRGISVLDLLIAVIPWAILLILTIGIHLWGESQIQAREGLEAIEYPELWKLGDVYSTLFLSIAVAMFCALAFSLLRYSNYLAVITPIQSAEVRSIFVIVFSLMVTGLSIWRVQKNGWEIFEKLVGSTSSTLTGVIVGLGFLAGTIAYLYYMPDTGWFSGFYLNFSRITPLLLAAAILIPFSQLFFSAFAFPVLEKRYTHPLPLFIAAALFSLVFAQPLILLLALALSSTELYRRTNSGFNLVLAHMILNVGLLLAVSFLPWVRSLFV